MRNGDRRSGNGGPPGRPGRGVALLWGAAGAGTTSMLGAAVTGVGDAAVETTSGSLAYGSRSGFGGRSTDVSSPSSAAVTWGSVLPRDGSARAAAEAQRPRRSAAQTTPLACRKRVAKFAAPPSARQ